MSLAGDETSVARVRKCRKKRRAAVAEPCPQRPGRSSDTHARPTHTRPQDFPYISDPKVDKSGIDTFNAVLKALADIGFSDDERDMLIYILSAILHISNITFSAAVRGEGAAATCCRCRLCPSSLLTAPLLLPRPCSSSTARPLPG